MNEEADQRALRVLRQRLIAIIDSFPDTAYINESFVHDFKDINSQVQKHLPFDAATIKMTGLRSDGDGYYDKADVASKFRQLLAVMNATLFDSERTSEAFIDQARDDDLRRRCRDILNSDDAYDRAINQATLVLEDKVRRFSGLEKDTGHSLFSRAINPDPAIAIIRISEDKDQQSGYAEICRGLVKVFRNPTHHQIKDEYTKLEAEAVCLFIDHLLDVIKRSVKK